MKSLAALAGLVLKSGVMKVHFSGWALVSGTLLLSGCAAVLPPSFVTEPAAPQIVVKPNTASNAGHTPEVWIEPTESALTSVPAVDLTVQETTSIAVDREVERGGASWYGPGFHGKRTANGERYDMHALTAAHKTLPFGTMVRVKSLVNGREVLVRITDRGPFSRNRVIDLSRAAAAELDMLGLGFKQVVLMVVQGEAVEMPALLLKRRKGR